jgi:hypothetical protein
MSDRLKRLGVGVERRLINQFEGAPPGRRLILLWSQGVARAAAPLRRLRAVGNISILRTAATPTPPALRARIFDLPRRRGAAMVLREAAAVAPTAQTQRRLTSMDSYGTSRWEGLLTFAVMALVVGWATYVVSPTFASRVDTTVASIDSAFTQLVE